MSTVFEAQDKFKSGYNASVLLIAEEVASSAVQAGDQIKLEVVGNKGLPGFEDAEEWDIRSDNPTQEIAEKIVGKFGGISSMGFEVLYSPSLMEKLVAHAKTKFTVRITYDDTEYDSIYRIDVLKCFLKNPGSSGGSSNNVAPTMTVTLQPRGGGKLDECIEVTEIPRP